MKRYLFAAMLLVLGPTFVNAQTTSSSCVVIAADLSIGSTDASSNTSVTPLQTFLHAQGFLTVNPTGYFGPLTSAAVSNFQTSVGLPTVGVVGPLTRAAIQQATCTRAAPVPPTQAPTPSTAPSTTPSVISTSTLGQYPESIGPGAAPPAATSTIVATSTATTTVATSTVATLPYKAETFYTWQSVWGQVTIGTTTGTLTLAGNSDNNGAEAIYPASEGWGDYRYTVNVSVANGNVGLIGRYVDSNDFLECNFSQNWVELDQTVGGSSTVLASKSVPGILSNDVGTQTTSMAMDVQGNTVGCAGYGPGDNITYTLPAGSPTQGGIGIESWYATPLADMLELENVEVDPL